MIRSKNEIELELAVNENFVIGITDAYSAEIQGIFDKNQIIETVQEWDEDPEDVCNAKKLQEYCETWAEENGYILQEDCEIWAKENGYIKEDS